jgi:transposase
VLKQLFRQSRNVKHRESTIYFCNKERNVIERMFNKMKQFRGIATRYGKTSVAFSGFIQLAAILLWLK